MRAMTQPLTPSRGPAGALARLVATQRDGQVVSLYASLHPADFPTLRARQIEIDSLLAHAQAQAERELPREQRAAALDDIERVRSALASRLVADDAHAVAAFSSRGAQIFEIVKLPHAVEPLAIVDERPFVKPLVEQATTVRWCMLLVSRRAARIFLGDRERIAQVADLPDDVHRRHSQGGWSQARYGRSIEHDVDAHIRRACAALGELAAEDRFDRLLLGGPAEIHNRVEVQLHTELRALLAGAFEVDVERASAEEVHRRAAPLIEADERGHELAAITLLEERRSFGDRVALGLDEVLELLNERRVETLLLAQGYAESGFCCEHCGRLSTTATPCPKDGGPPAHCEDVVERAIELALAEGMEVIVVRRCIAELERSAPVAALLRY